MDISSNGTWTLKLGVASENTTWKSVKGHGHQKMWHAHQKVAICDSSIIHGAVQCPSHFIFANNWFSQTKHNNATIIIAEAPSLSHPSSDIIKLLSTNSDHDMVHLSQSTLKVLVTTIDAQWEGMGDVGSARYEPALLPPSSTIKVLS